MSALQDMLLTVTGLAVDGPRGRLVQPIDLALAPGETVAIVGESGSGKSMTAKALTGLLPAGVHASGRLGLAGRELDLGAGDAGWRGIRGGGIALLLQDPFTSLSPVHRCGEQIGWGLAGPRRARAARAARAARVAALLAEVGLPERVARQYPFELSGGMRQRVALAAALAADPQVLIADEPTTALDVTTQKEVLDLVAGLQRSRDMALVLITHDLGVARSRADRILVMYAGRLVEQGPATAVLDTPGHPYSARLLGCEPPLEHRLTTLPSISGSVPQPYDVGEACAFAPRCTLAVDACRSGAPPLLTIGPDHAAACLRIAEVGDALAVAVGDPGAPDPASPTATGGAPLLRVTGLTKRFAGASLPALDDVGLEVARGEAVAVVGESGSGKTTLARCIVGLDRADEGSIGFADGSSPSRLRRVQIVFQDPYSALNPGLTIGTTLRETLRAVGRPVQLVEELLELVGLPAAYARRRPKALSGGERQRVAIARALAVEPELLVLDESVSALDVSVQAQVLNLLRDLQRRLDLTLLFITHDLAVARQVSQRVYVMQAGRVVEHGPTDEVLARPRQDYTQRLLASVPSAHRTQE